MERTLKIDICNNYLLYNKNLKFMQNDKNTCYLNLNFKDSYADIDFADKTLTVNYTRPDATVVSDVFTDNLSNSITIPISQNAISQVGIVAVEIVLSKGDEAVLTVNQPITFEVKFTNSDADVIAGDTTETELQALVAELVTATNTAGTTNSELAETVSIADSANITLNETIDNSNTANTTLNDTINTADAMDTTLNSTITSADTANTNLSSNISDANTINSTLVTNTDTATNINTTLSSSITSANTINTDLNESIDEVPSLIADIATEGNKQVGLVETEGDTQNSRIETIGNDKYSAINTLGNNTLSNITTEGNTQIANVIAEGNNQATILANGGYVKVTSLDTDFILKKAYYSLFDNRNSQYEVSVNDDLYIAEGEVIVNNLGYVRLQGVELPAYLAIRDYPSLICNTTGETFLEIESNFDNNGSTIATKKLEK